MKRLIITTSIIFIVLIIGILLLFRFSTTFFPNDINRNGEILKISLNIIGGYAVLIGLYLTYRRTISNEKSVLNQTEQIALSRESQIDDRFKTAIEHLGSDSEPILMGGVIELHQIAKIDKNKYRAEVFQVLCSFLKSKTSIKNVTNSIDAALQLIINLLFKSIDDNHFAYSGLRADLSFCDLSNFNFDNSNLVGADLEGAELPSLWNSSLKYADLTSAKFRTKHSKTEISVDEFNYYDISELDLTGANLFKTYFSGISLSQLRFNKNTAIRNVAFLDCKIANTTFDEITIHDSSFLSCEFEKIIFSKSEIKAVNFIGCDLFHVHFSNNPILAHVNFSGSIFQQFTTNTPFLSSYFKGCGSAEQSTHETSLEKTLMAAVNIQTDSISLNIDTRYLMSCNLENLTEDEAKYWTKYYSYVQKHEMYYMPTIYEENAQ